MQTIYQPRGRAQEYAHLALNLYRGCDHGCEYCFAPAMLRMKPADFLRPVPRPNILEGVKSAAKMYKGSSVFLCFSCDPYPSIEPHCELTRETIKILHDHDISVRILTKGGLRSTRDFDLLREGDAYGTTLTFCSLPDEAAWEPGAASYLERLKALIEAHERGIYTWVSCEPVIKPAQTLQLIEMSAAYVDEYKIGKWNHDARASEIDWVKFTREAVELLQKLDKKFYLKEDLRRYL